MRAIPWISFFFLGLAALVVLAPNLLLHFILDFIVSYRLVAAGLIVVASLSLLISIVRAREQTTRRLVAAGGVVAAIILGGVTLQRDWLAYDRSPFAFNADGATLRGTLFVPSSSGPAPAVVIAHGSPSIPRRLYSVWADVLVRNGFVVLIFDKRGTGEFQGSYDQQNNAASEVLDRHGRDLAAAVNALALDRRVDRQRISLVGLSQAGWTVPVALRHSKYISSFVLLSGPVCTTQEEHVYSSATGEQAGQNWSAERANADALVWKKGPGGFDPLPYLRESAVRGHWIFGNRDASIPVTRSAENLDALIAEGRPYSYEVLGGADHLLLSWSAGAPDFDTRVWRALVRELKSAHPTSTR